MTWNWQHSEWPRFTWDATRLVRAEAMFAHEAGIVLGATRHLLDAERDSLNVDLMTGDAYDTSRIEGEYLDRQSIQSSIRRQLGLAGDRRTVGPAEAGIAEMTVDMIRSAPEPLEDDTLFAWHGMIARDRIDLEEIGRYRTHTAPMRIVSRSEGRVRVHFEAPPSGRVPGEMRRLGEWFNGEDRPPPVTRAGIAHLWFESVHPFEDGNGRIGRAIAEKALLSGLSTPCFVPLAPTLLRRRREYYDELGKASRELEITDWLLWFASAVIEACRNTLVQVEFVIEKARLLDSLRDRMNPRQERALLRMFAEGVSGFVGGLSAKNYAVITGASPATVTRDLADLVAKGALRRTGAKKAARYHLDVPGMEYVAVGPADLDRGNAPKSPANRP